MVKLGDKVKDNITGFEMKIIANGTTVKDCPIYMEVCYRSCYWFKQGKCIFQPGGYDKLGRRKEKQNNETNQRITLT